MIEIWRDIKDYEGLYQISNYGRVKSLKLGKEMILKSNFYGSYLGVVLYKNGIKKKYYIHRLVAETFISNPSNLPCVNHRDEVKINNFCGTSENNFTDGNLEWCTYKYNTNYGTLIDRVREKNKNNEKTSKKVLQFTLDGKFVKEWESERETTRNGFQHQNVGLCCRGIHKSHKGFIWQYK